MNYSANTQIFAIGEFHLDAAKRQLSGPQGVVEVPSRAFDVLLYMVAHPGELLDKARLLKAVWPTTVVEESNLSQCIFALRRALGDTAAEPRFIATVPGRGYQFIAPVRESPAAELAPTQQKRLARWPLLAAAAAVILVAAAAGWRSWRVAAPPAPPVASAPPAPIAIAVLPFVDLSPAKDMEYFGDGLAEELISSLSKAHALRVTGRRSAYAFKGKDDDAQSIGAKLHVDVILEGSVRAEGNRVRISAQLTRTRDGTNLWAETYDRYLDDVLDVQGSIAQEVALAFAPLTEGSNGLKAIGTSGVAHTSDAEAYRAYLRGVQVFSRWMDQDPAPARSEFQRAVDRDPSFANAWGMLARTYELDARLGIGDGTENRARAQAALDRALKLDPAIADLWWVRMFFATGTDAPAAFIARDLENAVAANPDDIEPMVWLGHHYLSMGKNQEAVRMFERAYQTDPLSPMVLFKLGWVGYAYGGDRQRLLDLSDELERLQPREAITNGMRAGLAYREGRALDWDRFMAAVVKVDPTKSASHCSIATYYGELGLLEPALYHARICAHIDHTEEKDAYIFAHLRMYTGHVDDARALVRSAIARRPDDPGTQLSVGELQYFDGDCKAAARSIARARPDLERPAALLELSGGDTQATILIYCLRKQGDIRRVAEMRRVFDIQNGPPGAPGLLDGARVRMAAAAGDRNALVENLRALARTSSVEFTFAPHEPMIQPFLDDREVRELLNLLNRRHAQFAAALPLSSTRISIPGIDQRAAL